MPDTTAEIVEHITRKQNAAAARTNERKARIINIASSLKDRMKDEKTKNFHLHFKYIKEKYALADEYCRDFAQKWAVWQWVLVNYSGDLQAYNKAYNGVFTECPLTRNSFANVLKGCRDNGIEAMVIDHRVITKAQKRISNFQYEFIKAMYIQSATHTTAIIHKRLTEACIKHAEKPYSLASVKLYVRDMNNNMELYGLRYGASAAQKQMPYVSLLPAEHRNTQWQMDGWTMPFWGAKFQRYVMCCIWDNHSKKIVSYSVDMSENTVMILEALENGMRNTGVLPAEIVSDKHSFHKTDIAATLKREYEAKGGIWTVTMNAQRNQVAERYNQYLNDKCIGIQGYTGMNITAKGKSARPSPEHMQELAKAKNMLTEAEIKAIAAHLVHEYNNDQQKGLEGLTPNQKYEQSSDAKAFAISEQERVRLVRPAQSYKVIRGQINIKEGSRKYEYQLSAELIARYNNKKVHVVHEGLADGIYVFDLETGEYITDILPKRKVHGAIADQTEADKKILMQQAGRSKGVATKARKAANTFLHDALNANPEAIDSIPATIVPKSIRAIAQQDNALKTYMKQEGIIENMLPIRKEQPVTVPTSTMKKRESPFTPAHNTIRMLTPEEIYGITPDQ